MDKRTDTDWDVVYSTISKEELTELYYYVSNPDTDTATALADIRANYGDRVADLLGSMR